MSREKVPLKIVVPIIVVTWILSVVSSFAIVLVVPSLLVTHHEHNYGWHVSWRTVDPQRWNTLDQWSTGELGTSHFPPTFSYAWEYYVFQDFQHWIGFVATMQVEVRGDGPVTFTIGSDDAARLFIDDTLQIDNWKGTAYNKMSKSIQLNKGSHTLRLEWFDGGGWAIVSFQCDSDIFTWTKP